MKDWRNLEDVVGEKSKELVNGIGVEFGSACDEMDGGSNDVVLDIVTGHVHDLEDGVDVPLWRGGKLVREETDLGRDVLAELWIGRSEELDQLLDHELDVLVVDERVGQIERSFSDGNIGILETVEHDGTVALNGGLITIHDPLECVESDVSL